MITYLITRCHALRARLLSPEEIEALAKLGNVEQIAKSLLMTDYREQIEGLERTDAHLLERAINEKLVERCEFVADIATPEVKGFLREYFRRFEVQNIVRILRNKISKASSECAEESLLPLENLSDVDFEPLIKAESLEEAMDTLRNTLYEEATDSLRWCQKYDSLLPLEAHLKKVYYTRLFKALPRVPLSDRRGIKRLLGTEVDLENCFACTAPIVYGYDRGLVKKLVIPHWLEVPSFIFEDAVETESPDILLKLLAPYETVIRYLLEGNDLLARAEALRIIRRKAMLEASRSRINFAYVICYLILCELECKDLSSVVLGKQYNVSPKEMLELLACRS